MLKKLQPDTTVLVLWSIRPVCCRSRTELHCLTNHVLDIKFIACHSGHQASHNLDSFHRNEHHTNHYNIDEVYVGYKNQ